MKRSQKSSRAASQLGETQGAIGAEQEWEPLAGRRFEFYTAIPDIILAMTARGGYLIVDTEVKRYRIHNRAGRKPRVRMIGLLSELAA